jgi:hypothetical protein
MKAMKGKVGSSRPGNESAPGNDSVPGDSGATAHSKPRMPVSAHEKDRPLTSPSEYETEETSPDTIGDGKPSGTGFEPAQPWTSGVPLDTNEPVVRTLPHVHELGPTFYPSQRVHLGSEAWLAAVAEVEAVGVNVGLHASVLAMCCSASWLEAARLSAGPRRFAVARTAEAFDEYAGYRAAHPPRNRPGPWCCGGVGVFTEDGEALADVGDRGVGVGGLAPVAVRSGVCGGIGALHGWSGAVAGRHGAGGQQPGS